MVNPIDKHDVVFVGVVVGVVVGVLCVVLVLVVIARRLENTTARDKPLARTHATEWP